MSPAVFAAVVHLLQQRQLLCPAFVGVAPTADLDPALQADGAAVALFSAADRGPCR